MSDQFSAAVQRKAREFVATLQASVKVRRYAEAYLEHLLRGEPQPQEFKVGQGQPSFSYLRRQIDQILGG